MTNELALVDHLRPCLPHLGWSGRGKQPNVRTKTTLRRVASPASWSPHEATTATYENHLKAEKLRHGRETPSSPHRPGHWWPLRRSDLSSVGTDRKSLHSVHRTRPLHRRERIN